MLKGQAKKDYQREYMRNRRKKQGVKPSQLDPRTEVLARRLGADAIRMDMGGVEIILPGLDADGNPIYEEG